MHTRIDSPILEGPTCATRAPADDHVDIGQAASGTVRQPVQPAPQSVRIEACRVLVSDFVQWRMSADDFLPRFTQLWRSGDPDTSLPKVETRKHHVHLESSIQGVLDSINELSETYRRCLPTGAGYRVSEEQFRKAIQSLASTDPILDAGVH